MPPENSAYAGDWLASAQVDLARVQRRLDEGDVADAAFHLQQAIEKGLKGYLISRGWRLRRTHNLSVLLDEAMRHRPDLVAFAEMCREATAYYFADRYPTFAPSPSAADVAEAYSDATALIGRIVEEAEDV